MRVSVGLVLAVLALGGCALAHERGASDDAAITASDAAPAIDAGGATDTGRETDTGIRFDASVDACAAGRSEAVIVAPRARRAGYSILFVWPRASSDGTRVAASAEVISDRQGGIGMSDVLTYDAGGGAPRAFFTTDLPYVLGSMGGLEEYLGGGGFAGARVYGEIRRFRNDRFDVVRADDADASVPDAPTHVPLPSPDPTFSIFELAREGDRAVRFDDHLGVVVYAVTPGALAQIAQFAVPEGLALIGPGPRLSPSGRLASFRSGGDLRVLTVIDTTTGATRTHTLPLDAGAIAFLDDTRMLVLPRHPSDPTRPRVLAVSLADDAITSLDLALPADAASTDHFLDAIDVSADAETFVTTEDGGRRLRVVHCDPALRAWMR